MAVVLACILLSASQWALAQQARTCFYCGEWSVRSRVFYGADTLSINKTSIAWRPCGKHRVGYSGVAESEHRAIVRLDPNAHCAMHGSRILYVQFEVDSGDLALSLFETEEEYNLNRAGTWGVYVRK
jgi:hypothetical protein